MPSVNFAAVRAAISVPRALGIIGWRAVSWGSDHHRGPCPIHGSASRSRSMSVCSRVWYCHKCKIGGDVLDLWARLTGVWDWPCVAVDLCRRAGVQVPYQRFRRARAKRARRQQEEAQ